MSERLKAIEEAELEAKRFIGRVSALKKALKAEPVSHYGSPNDVTDFGVQHAAVQRSSLDLTRALSAIRRRGQ